MFQVSAHPNASGRRVTGKTLVIHIGDHKAGSTSIQTACSSGRVRLKDHKLFYPASLNHNYLRDAIMGKEKAAARTGKPGKPDLEQLAKEIGGSDADCIVISGEAFEAVKPSMMKDVVDQYFRPVVDDVRIIAYVRPHAARFLSSYAEQTKIGQLQSDLNTHFQKTKASGRLLFSPRFEAWRNAFGDALIVRPLLRGALRDGDVVHDFIHSSFGDITFEVDDGPKDNESLKLEDLMLVKLLQSRLSNARWGVRHGFGWELARTLGGVPRPGGATKLELHKDLARKIADTYADDARQMDEIYFSGAPLLMGELDEAVALARDTPQSTDPTDYFSQDEVRNLIALADTFSDIFEAKGIHWAAFFRKRRALAAQGRLPKANQKKLGKGGKGTGTTTTDDG